MLLLAGYLEQKTVGFDGAGEFVPNPVKNSMGEARRHIRLLIAKESARFTVTDPNTQLAFLKTRVFMDES
ncbi:MAG: hypothetical protein ABL862_01640 [Candidatus Nitrotoga sp.]